ncbi:uncharacterized protein zgc:113279 [Cololabis saira]|uniref:uncharacterized protein zgc:113279 n=1 Tax=Cololabis saira TaxID=129043 RepID=UPI002AD3D002|nr:uncharacterized protein zgc:113279 [Cololabis saira]
MRGRCEGGAARDDILDGGLSPPRPEGLDAAVAAPAGAPGPGGKGSRCPIYSDDKVYVGVRVRMPVRDLLRNIRRSRDQDSQAFRQDSSSRMGTGNLKRARSRSKKPTIKVKHLRKSLEELENILEVLEEDLRTCPSPPRNLSSSSPPAHAELSPDGYSDEYDDVIPSPESYQTYSPSKAAYHQPVSYPDCWFSSLQPSTVSNMQRGDDLQNLNKNLNQNLNSSAFFWTQLQKEEVQLMGVSDEHLLEPDRDGKTALHRAVCVGKRALVYAIATRVAALNGLDLKDSEGMTALLYAAKLNQHLMVADLVYLGANVNERNSLGKSCLHLSAENGYTRVLEVLKQAMMEGVYVDVEATDNSGMSVLQCVAVSLKNSVSEAESSNSRVHLLRQEQMMESLECLLQMDSSLLNTAYRSRSEEPEFAAQPWMSRQPVCPGGQSETPTVMF